MFQTLQNIANNDMVLIRFFKVCMGNHPQGDSLKYL
jgi:hypothetical protein